MSSSSAYLRNNALDHIFSVAAWTMPVNLYVGLFTDVLQANGTGTEVVGASYARQALTMSAAVNGNTSNSAVIDFICTDAAGWGEIVSVGVFDATSGGNLITHGVLGPEIDAFTAEIDDVFKSVAHGLAADERVTVYGPHLPAALSPDTIYYARDITTDTFKVSTSSLGPALDITDFGGGVLKKLETQTINNGDTLRIAATVLDARLR